MIINQPFEQLINTFGVERSQACMQDLLLQSKQMCDNWNDSIIDNSLKVNFRMDDKMNFVYKPSSGEIRKADISQFAFSQLCSRLGVPASYVQKCFNNNKTDLALQNFHAWANECTSNMLVRENNGVVRAVLSDNYHPFDSYKIIRTLNNVVDDTIYTPSQVYLTEDKLHLRFVNYEPLPFDNDKLYAGFTVDSSDVGRGSLNMKFFIYRFACKNGMVISSLGGTLFRQIHIGSNMSGGKLQLFHKALINVDRLSQQATKLIKESQKKFLSEFEVQMYLDKAKRELKLSEKSCEKLTDLVDNTYNRSAWGFMNSITELAHDFTLDTRIELESWAGELLTKVA